MPSSCPALPPCHPPEILPSEPAVRGAEPESLETRAGSWAGHGATAAPSVRLRLALEAVATGRALSTSEEAELAAAGWADATRDECHAELMEMARSARDARRAILAGFDPAAWAAGAALDLANRRADYQLGVGR